MIHGYDSSSSNCWRGPSVKICKRIEEGFGWLTTLGGLPKTALIGRADEAEYSAVAGFFCLPPVHLRIYMDSQR